MTGSSKTTLKKVFGSVLASLLLSFCWLSNASASEISLNGQIRSSWTGSEVSINGNTYGKIVDFYNPNNWTNEPRICIRNPNNIPYEAGDYIETQFNLSSWGNTEAFANIRLSNGVTNGLIPISQSVEQLSANDGMLKIIYYAGQTNTLTQNTPICVQTNQNNVSFSAYGNMALEAGAITVYKPTNISVDQSQTVGAINNTTNAVNGTTNAVNGTTNAVNDLKSQQQQDRQDDRDEMDENFDGASDDASDQSQALEGATTNVFGAIAQFLGMIPTWLNSRDDCTITLEILGTRGTTNLCNAPAQLTAVTATVSYIAAGFITYKIAKATYNDMVEGAYIG